MLLCALVWIVAILQINFIQFAHVYDRVSDDAFAVPAAVMTARAGLFVC